MLGGRQLLNHSRSSLIRRISTRLCSSTLLHLLRCSGLAQAATSAFHYSVWARVSLEEPRNVGGLVAVGVVPLRPFACDWTA